MWTERHTHTHIRRQNRIRQTHSLTLLIYVVWLLYMPTNSVRFASISNLGALHCELWIAHTQIWRPKRTQELRRKRITIEIRTPVLSFKRFYLLCILLRVCRLFLFWSFECVRTYVDSWLFVWARIKVALANENIVVFFCYFQNNNALHLQNERTFICVSWAGHIPIFIHMCTNKRQLMECSILWHSKRFVKCERKKTQRRYLYAKIYIIQLCVWLNEA